MNHAPTTARVPSAAIAAFAALALLASGIWLAAAPSPARGATHAVTIEDFTFAPATLSVQVGDTVTWTNVDSVSHTATSSSGPVAFDSGNLAQGATFSYTFTTPGTYAYFCEIHPNMTASITVNAAPAATTAPSVAPTTAATPAASSIPNTAALGADGTSRSMLLGAVLLIVMVLSATTLATMRIRQR